MMERMFVPMASPYVTFTREQWRALRASTPLVMAEKLAQVDSSMILLGESGVGKGVLAKYIHECSPRVHLVVLAFATGFLAASGIYRSWQCPYRYLHH